MIPGSGYSSLLLKKLNSLLPAGQTHDYRNYGIGGVSSLFGYLNSKDKRVPQHSDIVFFEYCVNDINFNTLGIYTLKQAGQSLESFIRHAIKTNPQCQIVLLLFSPRQEIDAVSSDSCQIINLYQNIAQHYGILAINITQKILEQHDLKHLAENLYEDKAHYSRPLGVSTVARIIYQQLLQWHSSSIANAALLPRKLYEPGLETLSLVKKLSTFVVGRYAQGEFKNSLAQETMIKIPLGSYLQFQLKGDVLGLYVNIDIHSGFVCLQTKTQKVVKNLFDIYCPQKNILKFVPFAQPITSHDWDTMNIYLCTSQNKDSSYEKTIREKRPSLASHQWILNLVGLAVNGEIRYSADIMSPYQQTDSFLISRVSKLSLETLGDNMTPTQEAENATVNSQQTVEQKENELGRQERKYVKMLLDLAKDYMRDNNTEAAAKCYQKAIALKPERSGAYAQLAKIYKSDQPTGDQN